MKISSTQEIPEDVQTLEQDCQEPEQDIQPSNEYDLAKKVLEYHASINASDFVMSLLANLNTRGSLSEGQIVYVLGVKEGNGRSRYNPKKRLCLRAQMENDQDVEEKKTEKKARGSNRNPLDLSQHPVEQTFTQIPPRADLKDCPETSTFPYMQFPFKYFNPMQSAFLPQIPLDNNVVICAATSAGKTTVAETISSETLHEKRKTNPNATVGYIAPLKALCKEKEQTWTDPKHPFSKCNISILTGDYILTEARKEELANADIICMSSEMLGSRIRRNKSERNAWLMDLSVLVVDESHLLTQEERGPNLEVALIKFTKVNPKCRIVFLSATMPNVDELGTWLTKLNNKPTTIIKSEYRPVELKHHFQIYPYLGRDKETAMLTQEATALIQKYPDDKFILFVHTKKLGYHLLKHLHSLDEICEFHCADLEKDERERIELAFRDRARGSLRIIIATSTLAMGLNMPARRVGVLGVNRGPSPVESLEIIQMCGRAGRVGIDTAGDAHIIINNQYDARSRETFLHPKPVTSQLGNISTLGFHLVSEIAEESVTDTKGCLEWFKRTLFYHQRQNDDIATDLLERTLEKLEGCNAIIVNGETNLAVTPIGKVSAWFYYSPFYISAICYNFKKIFQYADPTENAIAWALANTPENSNEYPIVLDPAGKSLISRAESEGYHLGAGAEKHFYAIYLCLMGRTPDMQEIKGLCRAYRYDGDRLTFALTILSQIGKYYTNLPGEDKLDELPIRLKYGIPSKYLELCLLPGVGTARARVLIDTHKVYSCRDLIAAHRMGKKIFGEDLMHKILPVAEEISQIGKSSYLKKRRNTNH